MTFDVMFDLIVLGCKTYLIAVLYVIYFSKYPNSSALSSFFRPSRRLVSLSKITVIQILISTAGSTNFMIYPRGFTGRRHLEN